MKKIAPCCGVEYGAPHLKGCTSGLKLTEPLIVFTTDFILQGVVREFDDLYDLYLEIASPTMSRKEIRDIFLVNTSHSKNIELLINVLESKGIKMVDDCVA